jgi:hypothetical protein
MSEVALPGAFVDDNSFNTSFDTDDPLVSDNFENDYISSIEEITNFMNNTACNEAEAISDTKKSPTLVRLPKGIQTLAARMLAL